jgi:hypothetical protein
MIIGLTNLRGENIPWEKIDVKKWRDFGVSPATLIYLASQGDRRKEVKGISASQWGKGMRQHWLERTTEVFSKPDDSIAAMMGTAKHAHVLTDGYNDAETGITTEKRFFDKSGRISAQIDQLIWQSKNIVELVDFKSGKAYSLKKFQESPEDHGYTYQLNLGADLVRLAHPDVQIPNLWIEWAPSDAKRGEMKIAMIPVPLFERGRALREFTEILAELDGMIDMGDTPDLCSAEERWERYDRKTGITESVRCKEYCPYNKHCLEVSRKLGEEHPLEGVL